MNRSMTNGIGVSIIIPFYNGNEFINAAVESILNQTHQKFEVLIIQDNGSMPVELSIKDSRVKIIENTGPKGAGSARYIGILKSRYDLIAFLDADDVWNSTKLTRQILFMQNNNLVFSYTGYTTFNNIKAERGYLPKVEFNFSNFCSKTLTICCSSVMLDKAQFSSFRRPLLKKRNDYEMWAYLFEQINYSSSLIAGLPEILTIRRIHSNNLTKNVYTLPYYNYKLYLYITKSTFKAVYWTALNVFNTFIRKIMRGV